MRKKARIILITILMLLSFNIVSLADNYYECDHIYDESGQGNSANGNVHGMAGDDYRAAKTGTIYNINVEGEIINLILPAGTNIPGSDTVKGYNSMSKGENNVPTGEIIMTQSDVEAALRAAGRNDLADSLAHDAEDNRYIMNVQQGIYMAEPGSNTYRWYSMEEINNMVANGDEKLAWDMWTPIKNGNEAWYDDNNQKGFATYSKLNKEESNKPTPTPSATPTPTVTPTATPTPTPTPTKTPTPIPTPNPNELFSLIYVNTPTCTKTPTTSVKIDNINFGVAEGERIPTSEELRIIGETNLLGKVNDIQNWKLVINQKRVYTAIATWHWGYGRDVSCSSAYKSGDEWIDTSMSWSDSWAKEEGEYSAPTYQDDPYDGEGDTSYAIYSVGGIYKICPQVSAASNPTIPAGTITYNVTYSANVIDTEGIVLENETIGGKKQINIPGVGLTMTGQSNIPGDSKSRVAYSFTCYLGEFDTEKAASDACKAEAKGPTLTKYWSVASDGPVTVSGGGGSKSYDNNCPVLAFEMGASNIIFNELGTDSIDKTVIENKSVEDINDDNPITKEDYEYETTYARHIIKGEELYDIPNVNSVKVFTPIYNEIEIKAEDINQLIDESYAGGNKIITLGDKFDVIINVKGPINYSAKQPDLDASKYVQKVEVHCEMCCSEDEWKTITTKNSEGQYVHSCTVPVYKKDMTTFKIYSRVTAENIGAGGKDLSQEKTQNEADGYYILTQTKSIYIVGKIYDLQVRTVDDTGWKIREAEKLSKLPAGEYKDNLITSYKYGIKLGYRAYFDLKTLGSEIENINIKPKIYYIDEEGNIKEDVTIYYKTSNTEYKKLKENDIEISMKMTTTKGDVNNKDFRRELLLSKTSSKFANINYLNKITIGGLNKIILKRENATITKYDGKEYIGESGDVSRRWFGEIYIPSSTIVVDNTVLPETMKESDVIKNIVKGKGVLEKGYLMITFENIEATMKSGDSYLSYKIARDENGIKVSPETPSTLVEEKEGKEKITLPNRKEIKNLPENFKNEDAPIIIYDVSLRKNNDYEGAGTH